MLKSMMVTSLVAGAAMLTAFAGATAQNASRLDLATLTCKEMMRLADRDREAVMGFYFGYSAAKGDSVVLDFAVAGDTADQVIDDCLSNPTEKAMAVFAEHSK